MRIEGIAEVIIDAVALEQVILSNAEMVLPKHSLLIIEAALADTDMHSLILLCERLKHTVELMKISRVAEEKWMVTFHIRKKTTNELIAEESGL
jgi:hypothetical protein